MNIQMVDLETRAVLHMVNWMGMVYGLSSLYVKIFFFFGTFIDFSLRF